MKNHGVWRNCSNVFQSHTRLHADLIVSLQSYDFIKTQHFLFDVPQHNKQFIKFHPDSSWSYSIHFSDLLWPVHLPICCWYIRMLETRDGFPRIWSQTITKWCYVNIRSPKKEMSRKNDTILWLLSSAFHYVSFMAGVPTCSKHLLVPSHVMCRRLQLHRGRRGRGCGRHGGGRHVGSAGATTGGSDGGTAKTGGLGAQKGDMTKMSTKRYKKAYEKSWTLLAVLSLWYQLRHAWCSTLSQFECNTVIIIT